MAVARVISRASFWMRSPVECRLIMPSAPTSRTTMATMASMRLEPRSCLELRHRFS